MGKPPQHETRHPGLLSLSLPSVQAGISTHPAKAGGVNRHIAWHTSLCMWSCSVRWMPGWWLTRGDQHRLTGIGSTLETCSWRCTIQMAAFTLLYSTWCLIQIQSCSHQSSWQHFHHQTILSNRNAFFVFTTRSLVVWNIIRYDSVYLTCSKKLTGSQLSLPHGINKKLKCKHP